MKNKNSTTKEIYNNQGLETKVINANSERDELTLYKRMKRYGDKVRRDLFKRGENIQTQKIINQVEQEQEQRPEININPNPIIYLSRTIPISKKNKKRNFR